MRPLSPTHLMFVNEFARESSNMGYHQAGDEIMASLLPVVIHIQKLSY